MTRTARRAWLTFVAVFCGVVLAVALAERAEPRTLSARPADWMLAGEIVQGALDRETPLRFELWRASYAHAMLLAPYRRNPPAAFVRAGLFHWLELEEPDRARVLNAAAPLMRDPDFFARMHRPLLQLTGDFGWIRRNAPPTLGAREALRRLAMERGLFGEYRLLDLEVRKARLAEFDVRRRSENIGALVNILPTPLDEEDRPLVQAILDELHRQAFDPSKVSARVEDVVRFALDRRMQPLQGVAALLEAPSPLRDPTRARVALALDRASVASRIEVTSDRSGADWRTYYLERARFEGIRGNPDQANAYLSRAAAESVSIPVLAAAADVAGALRREEARQRFLRELAKARPEWDGLCGSELCTTARRYEWAAVPKSVAITATRTQSDEIAPYLEIFVDGFRLAQGEVTESRTFTLHLPAGAHAVEVRLVNTHMRNGVQRRVRLS
jgi:hypothetical protein